MSATIHRIPNYAHEAAVLAERHRQGISRRTPVAFPWERSVARKDPA